jgi:hypothetical protein
MRQDAASHTLSAMPQAIDIKPVESSSSHARRWFAWLSLHLLNLRGRRNRLVVLFHWLAIYFSPTRRAGVITRPERTNHAQPDFLPDPILASRRSRG